MIGLLLSSWRRFFVSGTMILEYFLVMAEGYQRQNWTVYVASSRSYFLTWCFLCVLYFEYDFA